jgi:predicted KAP-like P-loop ATPase
MVITSIKYRFSKSNNKITMGILKLFNLIGNGNKGTDIQKPAEAITEPDSSVPEISEDLFVDNHAPEAISTASSEDNALKKFLDTDFYSIGYNDGYDNHSELSFKEKQISMVHNFIFAIETVISQKNDFISNLRMHILNIGDTSETDKQIAMDKISEVSLVIQMLENERTLAYNNGSLPVNGLVMKAISQYRSGYSCGLRAYSEEKFFAKSTGLFN